MECTNEIKQHIMVNRGFFRYCLACGMTQWDQKYDREVMLRYIAKLRSET